MESDLYHISIISLAFVLIGATAAVELALTTVNRSEIRKMSEEGIGGATVIDMLLRDPARFLLTSMLLKTLSLVMAGIAVARLFGDGVGLLRLGLAVVLTWIVFAVVQVASRAFTAPHSQSVALRLAPFMLFAERVLLPITALLRQFGLQFGSQEDEEPNENIFLTEDGLRLLFDVGEEEESIPENERQMIASILGMDEKLAREVMVPRIDVVALDVETSLYDALEVILSVGHSRIPVYEGNIDLVIGFLYAKDLLQCFQDAQTDVPIRRLLRPAYFVPVTKRVNALLREMQKQRVHIAMVVDEYGGTAGLVTIEDIIEEIVGDIQDEYDPEEDSHVVPIAPDTYLLNSRLDTSSLSKLLETELSDNDADTLGGMIYSQLGHVPTQGESLMLENWRFTVLSLEGRRIDQVRAELLTENHEGQGEAMVEPVASRKLSERSALNLSPSEFE